MKAIYLASICVFGAALAGCSGENAGDVEAANKAAQAAPKSADQLPQDMPPEARRTAEAAIGQQQAMSAQMQKENEARMKVMQNMRGK